MKKLKIIVPVLLVLFLIVVFILFKINQNIRIIYPYNQTVFPPEFPAPSFSWSDKSGAMQKWEIQLFSANGLFSCDTIIDFPTWVPDVTTWEQLKKVALKDDIFFTVKRADKPGKKTISFCFATDSVGAPVLYRQMPIPFVVAEKELESMDYKLLNVGSINPPYTAMHGFSVCGNCHSFNNNGNFIGLDLDAGRRDKGGYFISPVTDSIKCNIENYLSWTKNINRKTFGLFSKISPDGRYIITTIKDRVYIKNFSPDSATNAFSQLFVPVNGVLAIYDRETKQLKELNGANLGEYVQTNPAWTPDGKNIVFSRAKAIQNNFDTSTIDIRNRSNMERNNTTSISEKDFLDAFILRDKIFQFEICIVPFNDGKGGEATPVKGASENGMSNFFPAVSPDGKWIAFCQARNFMLLQPDSRLFIVPLQGGKSKKLSCNLSLMNSWHAWSPNSKWIVFASKGLSIYTDLFLTYINNKGKSSPPVLLEKARQYQRVTNYPEFVPVKPDFTFYIHYDYVELAHIERAVEKGETDEALKLYKRFIKQDPILFNEDYYVLYYLLKKAGIEKELDSLRLQLSTKP